VVLPVARVADEHAGMIVVEAADAASTLGGGDCEGGLGAQVSAGWGSGWDGLAGRKGGGGYIAGPSIAAGHGDG
jgi:hypothetical protein